MRVVKMDMINEEDLTAADIAFAHAPEPEWLRKSLMSLEAMKSIRELHSKELPFLQISRVSQLEAFVIDSELLSLIRQQVERIFEAYSVSQCVPHINVDILTLTITK